MDEKFKSELKSFAEALKVEGQSSTGKKRFLYHHYPLLGNQAIYVLSMRTGELVYHRNIDQLLGYSPSEFTYDAAFELIHPEDYPIVKESIKVTLDQAIKTGISQSAIFRIIFRMRKKDGEYIWIMRTSGICSLHTNKTLNGHFSIIEDISFLQPIRTVKWEWSDPNNEFLKLRQDSSETDLLQLTKREKQIFNLLYKGQSSRSIAEELNISIDTVYTHRKNLLKKSGVQSSFELLRKFDNGELTID